MKFATIPCCCGGTECFVCQSGTTPAAWQVTPSGVLGGFNPLCCNDCDAWNQPFTIPWQQTGAFDGAPACYWLQYLQTCQDSALDYIRVILWKPTGLNARLTVEAFGAKSPVCALAPQPLFKETHIFGAESIDCGEVDLTFPYTRPDVSGDTAVCDWKSANVHVLALP